MFEELDEVVLEESLGSGGKEAVLYYLYMMADGGVTYGEEKIFDAICKELGIEDTGKELVTEKCKKFADDTDDIFNMLVRGKIDERVGQRWYGELKDASSLARIIWNLLNLGYADTFYSDEERKIVGYLVDKWSVSPEVYQELVDTADTMLALTKQKEWFALTLPEGTVRAGKEKYIDSQIEQLLDDVKLTIEELTM